MDIYKRRLVPRPKAWSFAKYGPQIQFGGTIKYVATKICVATGHSSKLAMLRKLPEVTNSDLPPLLAGAMVEIHVPMVGIHVPLVGTASNTYKDTILTLIMTCPTYTLLSAILLMAVGRWSSN